MTPHKEHGMKKIQGLHPYRFRKNPEEKRFAKKWIESNKHDRTLAYLLLVGDQNIRPPEPADRDHTIAATVIQWLGSSVGQFFLRELGYEKKS